MSVKTWRWFGWFRPSNHPKPWFAYQRHFGAEFRVGYDSKEMLIYEVKLGQGVNPRRFSGWRRWIIELVIERLFLRDDKKP